MANPNPFSREGLDMERSVAADKLRRLEELSFDTMAGKAKKTTAIREMKNRMSEIDSLLYDSHVAEEMAQVAAILDGDQPETPQ